MGFYNKPFVGYYLLFFNDVYPLFGQIDIKGSSTARNDATQQDLVLQLQHVEQIIERISKVEDLPIYEQLIFRISNYREEIKTHLEVDTERRVLNFLRNEIVPLYDHLAGKSEVLADLIQEYRNSDTAEACDQ